MYLSKLQNVSFQIGGRWASMNRNLFFRPLFFSHSLPRPAVPSGIHLGREDSTVLWKGRRQARNSVKTRAAKKGYSLSNQADTKQGQPKVQFRNRPAQFGAPKRLLKPIGEILGSCKSPIKTKTKKLHKMQRRFCHLIWQFLPYFFRLLLFCHIDRN